MRTPALYALIFFASGILLASNTNLPSLVYLGLAVLATSLALITYLIGSVIVSRILIALALISSGGFLTELQTSDFPSNHISYFTAADDPMMVVGVVASEPDIRPTKTFLTVLVDSLEYRGRKIASIGNIRLQIQEPTSAFNYCDRIKFSGYVNRPQEGRNPGAFNYRRYLAIRQISAVVNLRRAEQITLLQSGSTEPFVRTIVLPIRDYISSVFEKFLPAEQAAVMKGFLIGDVRSISPQVYQRFKDTGTLHVLAASGANVGYVTLTLLLALKLLHLPRRYRVILLIIGVVIFSFLAYNQPSVVRASVMAIVGLVGIALYRDTNWLNTISFAGLLILVFRPLYLYDLGWQLSFAAAYALILFMPAFERLLPRRTGVGFKALRYFLLILFGSIVAQLGVTPILIYNFHTVPLVSFIANLMVVPLVGVATTFGIILIFVSAVPLLSTAVAYLLMLALKITLQSLDYFHALQIPQLRLAAPQMLLVIIYYVSLQLIFSLAARRKAVGLFVVILLLSINTLVWKEVIAKPKSDLQMTFLDTFDTNTTFIKQNKGESILINGGGIVRSFDRGEAVVLPFLRSRGVDHLDRILVTTEADSNTASLLSVINGLENKPGDVEADSFRILSQQQIQRSDSVIFFSGGNVRVLLLTRHIPVQNWDKLPSKIHIVAADWSFLAQREVATLIRLLQPETIVITSYPSRYTSLKQLEDLRKQFPQIRFYSVLESGGIVIEVGMKGYRVLATANN